ncbi:MAG: 3-isopropylmalate dehydrogenase [Bacteroidota bacterium]
MEKKICLLPGDGIGPIVTKQAQKVMRAIEERYDHRFNYCVAEIGASAIKKVGDALPEFTIESCLNSDVTFIGAVGDPKYDNDLSKRDTPDRGLLRLRKAMKLQYNIRPVRTFSRLLHISPLKSQYISQVDFSIYRELSSGIYFGNKGRKDSTSAYDDCTYRIPEIEAVAYPAFEAARQQKKPLTLVDRANVLETSRLWREVVQDIAKQYSDVEYNTLFIDHALAELLMNPQQFGIILTTNLFGDLMSDAVGVITGSVRLIPSISLGEDTALFEPIYSAYSREQDLNTVNPIAAILSVAMMMEYFGLPKEARAVRSAVTSVLSRGVGTPDLNLQYAVSTADLGDYIAAYLLEGVVDERAVQRSII